MKGCFKVGDIVKGKKDNGYGITNDAMLEGEVVGIDNIYTYPYPLMTVKVIKHRIKGYENVCYRVRNSNDKFELVKKYKNIVIFRKDNKVIAKDNNTGIQGVAKCSPEDKFDFMVGAKLAMDRLMDACGYGTPKLYTGKVVCVKKPTIYEGFFTVGKIYNIEDGYCKLDNNTKFLFKNFTTVDDLNRRLGNCFIEVVE